MTNSIIFFFTLVILTPRQKNLGCQNNEVNVVLEHNLFTYTMIWGFSKGRDIVYTYILYFIFIFLINATIRVRKMTYLSRKISILEQRIEKNENYYFFFIQQPSFHNICCMNFTESEKSQLFATKCQIFVKSLRRRKHQQNFLNWNVCL